MAKILVIDDDTSLLQLIKNALENDHSITTYTGLSGVSIRDINTHDLLILDVMMPELDGFTFLKEKRREIDIPVLFLTAKSFEQDLIARKIYVNEAEINMTSTEYEICSLLMRNPNRVFTKDEIYEKIFGFDGMGDAETTIRERIKEIRKKFKGYQEEPIKTIWGVGYQWEKNQ